MRILFDTKQMKVGCVLLQAIYRCDSIAHLFDNKHWFLSPTQTMAVYEINERELKQLQEKLQNEVHVK